MSRDTILVHRIGGALWPADERSAERVRKLPRHQPLGIKLQRSRSPRQNSLYWAVLEKAVAATGHWRTPEELHAALKVATGCVDIIRLVDGRRVLVPGSTAFATMSQDAAQDYYDAALRIVCDEVMGGIGIDELLAGDLVHSASPRPGENPCHGASPVHRENPE